MQAPANKAKPAAKGASDNMIGKTIGGCRIESLLGRGAMGAVYKARQVSLDRDVAVKVIRPEMMTDPRMLKRFEVEARTVGKFNSAHVVMVHDVGFEHGVHYLVMEFVQGKNMREHTKLLAGGRLPAGEAIPLLRQACKGLEEAQRLSVIHRDIKPDNLMLTDRGVLKIADFGIAKPIHEDFNMTMTSELIGTPLYMSPEQCQGKADLDFRSDMYSLGATFYYLLTGEPPIRASSVYELIQTKTKLENLCLWKALAELDQNHPLSRVIERMTSLDREDRYESYEALFNDIVLVEQGGTVTIPEKGSVRARAARAKVKKKERRNVLAGVVLLLAVAGGGYAWSTSAGGGGPGDGKGVSVPDSKQLTARLTSLRTRLASNGPDSILRAEVDAVPEEPTTKASRGDLLEDVDRGLVVRAKLDKLKPPDSLAVPFEDLKAYFASVDKALEVEGDLAGRDLQAWLVKARVGARQEIGLGPMAVSSLTFAFGEWQADRAKAGNDEPRLLALRKRLDDIEAGRRTLLALIPSQEGQLNQKLPVKSLDSARQSLTDKSVPAVGDVDVAEVLTEIRQKFEASGPDAALEDRTKKLLPTRDDQKTAKDELLVGLERASGVRTLLEETRATSKPEDPELPFESVETYYTKIERALDPLRTGDALPRWAEELRTKLRDEKKMQASVMRACKADYGRWSRQRESSRTGGEELVAELQQLKAGIARGGRLFPDIKQDLDKIIPAAAEAEVKAESERGKAKEMWFVSSRKLLDTLRSVKQLADWRNVAKQSTADLEVLRTAAADFTSDPAVNGDLQGAVKLHDAWVEADKRVIDLASKIAAGDLKGAETVGRLGVPDVQGREEFGRLNEAAIKCRGAFEALDTSLAIDETSALLVGARESMKACASLAPAADQRIKTWIDKVSDLKNKAAGMVQIEVGSTKAYPQQVQAFFIASQECSIGDFNKFMGELREAVKGINDRAGRLQAVSSRLAGAELTEERLDSLLKWEKRLRVSEKLPVDRLDWHAAAAYCAWNGLVLPRPEEWALASFGNGNRFEFPWGPEWSSDPRKRNPSNTQLVEVDEGGLSWRTSEGKNLHHLAGNVAEWLAAEPGAASAQQAGGRYDYKNDAPAKEAARGTMATAEKSDMRTGVGFRAALRPRTFIGQLWPR